jgi:hypothetical protein
MARPRRLDECDVTFLNDGYLVTAYPDAEVTPTSDGNLLVSIPVAYYDEEWQWLYGGYVYVGTEPQDGVVAEARQWLASLTGVPV